MLERSGAGEKSFGDFFGIYFRVMCLIIIKNEKLVYLLMGIKFLKI